MDQGLNKVADSCIHVHKIGGSGLCERTPI